MQPLGEDLGPAARHGVQPRLLEPRQGLARLDLPAPPEVVDLGRGEGLDLGLGPGVVDRLDHPLEVLEGPVRVVPAHDMRLAGARLDHRQHVLDRVLECARFALLASKVTKAAGKHTYIGWVDVAVEHEEDLVSMLPGLDHVRHAADGVEVLGLEEGEPVLTGEALAALHLVPDRGEAGVADPRMRRSGDGHVCLRVRVSQTDQSVWILGSRAHGCQGSRAATGWRRP